MSRPVLKKGSRGAEVKELQALLKAAGYYQAYNLDGIFGSGTESSVLELQEETARLVVDGIVGAQTWGALSGLLVETPEEPEPDPDPSLEVTDETWSGWQRLVELVTTTPVVYGPGRGAFSDGQWIVRDKSGNYPHGAPWACQAHLFARRGPTLRRAISCAMTSFTRLQEACPRSAWS